MTIESIRKHFYNSYSKLHQKLIEKDALPVLPPPQYIESSKTYYVIRRRNFEAGFFSNYIWALRHIIYAINNHMIPVVDFKNYYTLYNEFHPVNGEWNSWNYYFDNPVFGESIDNAYKSNNYFMCDLVSGYDYIDHYEDTFRQTDYLYQYAKDHTMIKKNLLDEFDNSMQIIGWNNKILGVHYRATDKCIDFHDGLHEKTSDISDYLKISQIILEKDDLSRIFLATDEKSIISQFESLFGRDMIITNNAFRSNKGTTGIHELEGIHRKNHHYLLGKEVLMDTYMLSRTASLICGKSNVTEAAIIWNNNQYKSITTV